MATKDNVQGVVLALFGASAGGHLAGLTASATANGLTAVAGDLAASAGFILGKDLSTAAAFRDNMLTGLGISSTNSAYAAAAAWADGELAKAGANRGEIVASAVNFLAGLTDSTSPFYAVATAYRATVTAAVTWSEGAGATVFGVAALQAQQGTSSNVVGSTFTLTSEDDTPVMTGGNDTVNATTATLANEDRVFDPSSTDADVLNIVATRALPTAMDVTNVEAINIDWQSFSKPDVDLTDVTGATVTLTSTKAGYTGHADFDAVGSNKVVTGAGIVGDVTVEDAEDTTITVTAARSLDVNLADGTLVIDAGVAETVSVTAAEDVTLTALSADSITIDTDFDTANITIGVDADITIDGAADALVTITSAVDVDVEIQDNNTVGFEKITLSGAGAIGLTFADGDDADELELVNGTVVTLDGTIAATSLDLTKVDADEIRIGSTLAAGTHLLASGTNIVLEADLGANANVFATKATLDSGSDVITITVEDEQDTNASSWVFDTDGQDFETINVVVDANADFDDTGAFNFESIDAGTTGALVVTSADEDVEVGIDALVAAQTLDATAVAGDFTVVQTGTDAIDMNLGNGDNTVTTAATTSDVLVMSGSGDDTVTIATVGGLASLMLGAGNNAITANTVTTGTLYVEVGAGDDTVSAIGITSGEATLLMGDGDNTITFGANFGTTSSTTPEISVTTGSGDDTVILAGGSGDLAAMTLTLGSGVNTIEFAQAADVSDYTITETGLDAIQLSEGNGTDAIVKSSLLSGKTLDVYGAPAVAGTFTAVLGVEMSSTTTSFDGSNIDISDSLTTGAVGLTVSGGKTSGTVTVTLTNGADVITGTAADMVINGGAGADTITGSTGDDTITGGTGADAITLGGGENTVVMADDDGQVIGTVTAAGATLADADTIAFTGDKITGFVSGTDTFDVEEGFTSIAAATAITAGTLGVTDGTVKYVIGDLANGVFTLDAAGGADLLVVYDADGTTGTVDVEAVVFVGITSIAVADFA